MRTPNQNLHPSAWWRSLRAFAGGLLLVLAPGTWAATPVHTTIVGPQRYIVELGNPERFDLDVGELQGMFERDLATLDAFNPPEVEAKFNRLIAGVVVTATAEQAKLLGGLDYVEGVYIDGVRSVPQPVTAAEPTLRGLSAKAPETSVRSLVSSDIVVAVIDSGIDYEHPALGGGYGPGQTVIGGYDLVDDDADPIDTFGHGTAVAGRIAAESDRFTGSAPGVSLLAYRVLDDAGQGRDSTIIRAMEMALDPNQDGDFSDRADVVNLSLGGPGDGRDLLSRAVNRLVEHGIVVCVSAGNDGAYHTIGSPGSAALAITVGSVGETPGAAWFSSAGPSWYPFAIKPDVLAAGAEVISTQAGGGFGIFYGTSFSAPVVSGIAARLLDEHPTWNPARVKAALMQTAYAGVEDGDVFRAGSGSVFPSEASGVSLFALTPSLNFGLVDSSGPVFEKNLMLTIANDASELRSVTLETGEVLPGVEISIDEVEIPIAAGGVASVMVALRVDPSALPYSLEPHRGYFGTVRFGTAELVYEVPWSFIHAPRLSVRHQDPLTMFGVSESSSLIKFGGFSSQTDFIFPSDGPWELLFFTDGEEPAMIIAEETHLDGPLVIDLDDLALHEIRGGYRATDGMTLRELPAEAEGAWYVNQARVILPEEMLLDALTWETDAPALRLGTVADRYELLISEFFSDTVDRDEIYIVQYDELSGIEGDRLLPAPDLVEQPLRVLVPPDEAYDLAVRNTQIQRDDEGLAWSESLGESSRRAPGDHWEGSIRVSRPSHETFSFSAQVGLGPSGGETYLSQPFWISDSRVVTSIDPTIDPFLRTIDQDESLSFGAFVYPTANMTSFEGVGENIWILSLRLFGGLQEMRRDEVTGTEYEIFGRSGEMISSGTFLLDTVSGRSGSRAYRYRLRLETDTPSGLVRGELNGSVSSPTLQMFRVVNEEGAVIHEVTNPRSTFLEFSGDGQASTIVSLDAAVRKATSSMSSPWIGLDCEQELSREGRLGVGRCSLSPLSAVSGRVDLRLTVRNVNLEETEYVVLGVLDSDGPGPKRRRPVRR